jgi:hypothetical protein
MSIRSPPLSPTNVVRDTRLAPQTRNPISLRLYKVLGTNFSDEATKEALQTLSDLYVPSIPKTGSLKGKEVQRDVEELEDDAEDDMLWGKSSVTAVDSGGFVENVAGESAARARKNLRRDMENKLAEGSRQFLKAFGEVDQVSIPCFRVTSQINQDMCCEEIKRATGTC